MLRYIYILTQEEISTTKLCTDINREFGTYLRYIKTLRFVDKPDYNYLRNLFRHCLKSNNLTEDFIFDWMSLRTPSPFVTTTTEASPQEGKPIQQTVSKAFDEIKLKDMKNPEIIVEEEGHSPQQNSSFGKAESSVCSVSVLCSPCLSVTQQQVGQTSPVRINVYFTI